MENSENNLENLIDVKTAAELLGLSRVRVLQFINSDRLPAQKIGGVFLIVESDLKLLESRGGAGRPSLNSQTYHAKWMRKFRAQKRELKKELLKKENVQ